MPITCYNNVHNISQLNRFIVMALITVATDPSKVQTDIQDKSKQRGGGGGGLLLVKTLTYLHVH